MGGIETGCGDVFLEKSEGNREFGVGFYAKRGQWGWETVGWGIVLVGSGSQRGVGRFENRSVCERGSVSEKV